MKILLDTHTFIWYMEGNEKLGEKNKILLDAIENEKFLSMASIWEMALKKNSGKLTLSKPLQSYVPPEITIIDVKLVYIFHLENLPEYHKDPFDRIIIATSIVEQMPLMSIDEVFEQYDVLKIWNN